MTKVSETAVETTPAKKVKAEKVVAEKAPKAPGVIATIISTIQAGPITMAGIVEKLTLAFPERDKEAMTKTVKAQLGGKARPTRLEDEKDVKLTITVDKDGVKSFSI